MGVEPTAARSARPATSFEDWGAHRDTTTPNPTIAEVTHYGKPLFTPTTFGRHTMLVWALTQTGAPC